VKFLAAVAFCFVASAAQAQDVAPKGDRLSVIRPAVPPAQDAVPRYTYPLRGEFTLHGPPAVKPEQPLLQHPVERSDGAATAVIKPPGGLPILPPAEFDRPFKGPVTIIRAATKEGVGKICNLPPTLGCTLEKGDRCTIVIADDDIIAATGFTTDIVRRHEVGHCNGWDKAHPNGRPIQAANGRIN
jgi:hypothetical protein